MLIKGLTTNDEIAKTRLAEKNVSKPPLKTMPENNLETAKSRRALMK